MTLLADGVGANVPSFAYFRPTLQIKRRRSRLTAAVLERHRRGRHEHSLYHHHRHHHHCYESDHIYLRSRPNHGGLSFYVNGSTPSHRDVRRPINEPDGPSKSASVS